MHTHKKKKKTLASILSQYILSRPPQDKRLNPTGQTTQQEKKPQKTFEQCLMHFYHNQEERSTNTSTINSCISIIIKMNAALTPANVFPVQHNIKKSKYVCCK